MSITLISLHTVQKNLQKIALLAQTSEHPTGMTVEEVVSYGRYPYQKLFSGMDTQDHEAIEWALDATGLAGFRMRISQRCLVDKPSVSGSLWRLLRKQIS